MSSPSRGRQEWTENRLSVGDTLRPPRGTLCTTHSSRRQDAQPRLSAPSRAHTPVSTPTRSQEHTRGAPPDSHLNRGKRLLNEVKSKDPQLSQPQEGAPPPAPSGTSGLNQGAEPRQVLQPRSAVYESLRRAPAPLQEFTATSVERADSSRTRRRPGFLTHERGASGARTYCRRGGNATAF